MDTEEKSQTGTNPETTTTKPARFVPVRDHGWKVFREAVRRLQFEEHLVGISEARLLFCLAGYAFRDGRCFPSPDRLCRDMGKSKPMTERNLRILIRSLEALELIETTGRGRKRRYYFINPTRYGLPKISADFSETIEERVKTERRLAKEEEEARNLVRLVARDIEAMQPNPVFDPWSFVAATSKAELKPGSILEGLRWIRKFIKQGRWEFPRDLQTIGWVKAREAETGAAELETVG